MQNSFRSKLPVYFMSGLNLLFKMSLSIKIKNHTISFSTFQDFTEWNFVYLIDDALQYLLLFVCIIHNEVVFLPRLECRLIRPQIGEPFNNTCGISV